MKLSKRIIVGGVYDKSEVIGGQEFSLVYEDIRLNLDRAGRAVFQVVSSRPLKGEVRFFMSWNFDSALTLFFTGDIERSTPVDATQQRLFCREVSARLDAPMPLAMRHPTMREVIQEYVARTGLHYIVPERAYATTRVPAFGAVGSGYHGMASLGAVFGIDDYICTAQGNGSIFAGSWADSKWAKRPLDVPQSFFSHTTSQSQTITAIPNLRPGTMLNGGRITALRFTGHTMEVTCKKQ